MRGVLSTFIASALVLSAAVACGGGGGSNQYCDPSSDVPCFAQPDDTPTPVPPTYCDFPNGAPPKLVFPAPAASNIPASEDLVILADTSTAGYQAHQFGIELSPQFSAINYYNDPSSNRILRGLQFLPAVLPATAALAPPGSIFEGTQVPSAGSMLPKTIYYVYVSRRDTFLCSPNGPIGSFKTQ